MNRDNQNIIQSNAGLVADVRDMIEQTRSSVAHTLNAGMTYLYWRIGKRIQMEVLKYERAEYGRRIIATPSQELSWSHFMEILPLDQPLQRDFIRRNVPSRVML